MLQFCYFSVVPCGATWNQHRLDMIVYDQKALRHYNIRLEYRPFILISMAGIVKYQRLSDVAHNCLYNKKFGIVDTQYKI